MSEKPESACGSETEGVKISMWSGPRNISTAMMRAFENRHDTEVLDEPFYAHYLATSHAEHPYRAEILAAYPARFDDVVAWLDEPPRAPARMRFFKHIAFHVEDDAPLDFLLRHRSFALIRRPEDMAASYARKFDDLSPIVRSYTVARRMHAYLSDHGRAFPVVASEDVLADPEGVLTGLCAALGVSFDPAMLAWPAGARDSDGPWAPHWYDAVNASTGFDAPKDIGATPTLSAKEQAAADACRDDYAFLHAMRVRAS